MILKIFLITCVSVLGTFGEDAVNGTEAKPKSKLEQGTLEQRLDLFKELMDGYERNVNPQNPNVQFGVTFISLDFDESKSTLNSNGWLKLLWYDSRLTWDSAKHPISVLRMEYANLWHPDITLYNAEDLSTAASSCWESNVLVYPSGKVLWVPPCRLSSYCKTTLHENPYGEQTCFLKFGSWTFDSDLMDLNFYRNDTKIDLSDFWDLSNWKVISTSGVKNVKFYDCCAEPYSDLTFNVTIQKKRPSDSACSSN